MVGFETVFFVVCGFYNRLYFLSWQDCLKTNGSVTCILSHHHRGVSIGLYMVFCVSVMLLPCASVSIRIKKQ